MRAEEGWLLAACTWLAAILIIVDGPLWIAIAAAGLCVGMSLNIHRHRAQAERDRAAVNRAAKRGR
jgi:hypothetical protein